MAGFPRRFLRSEKWCSAAAVLRKALLTSKLHSAREPTDRMDIKLQLDSKFEEARPRNSHESKIKRVQLSMCSTMWDDLCLAKWTAGAFAWIIVGRVRYFPDERMELGIGGLPPAEVQVGT